jgi:hypothetical protein
MSKLPEHRKTALRAMSTEELEQRRTALGLDMAGIDQQLSDSKADLLEHRATLLADGMNTREAVIRSSGDFARDGDTDWRQRAIGAKMAMIREITEVKAILKERAPGAKQQTVRLLTGSYIQELETIIAEGNHIQAMAEIDGRLLVVLR